jgi:predicted transcriptional regulator
MNTDSTVTDSELVSLTTELVAAYVGNNAVQQGDLPQLIASVHTSCVDLGLRRARSRQNVLSASADQEVDHARLHREPRRWAPLQILKRHLAGRGLTPEQYRRKWGLAGDYPMVAPNYAKQRSELAKAAGLGRKREETPVRAGNGRRRTAR